jgi:hypothetical protein
VPELGCCKPRVDEVQSRVGPMISRLREDCYICKVDGSHWIAWGFSPTEHQIVKVLMLSDYW